MADDLGEKTEDPTPRKLQKARDEGQIAKSTDLASALTLAAATAILWVFAAPSLDSLGRLVELGLRTSGDAMQGGAGDMLSSAAAVGLAVLAPLVLAAWAAAYLAHVWQVGFGFRSKPIEPSGSLPPSSASESPTLATTSRWPCTSATTVAVAPPSTGCPESSRR